MSWDRLLAGLDEDNMTLDELEDLESQLERKIRNLEDYITQHGIFQDELARVEAAMRVKEREIDRCENEIAAYEDSLIELNESLEEVDEDTKESVRHIIEQTETQMETCKEKLEALRGR